MKNRERAEEEGGGEGREREATCSANPADGDGGAARGRHKGPNVPPEFFPFRASMFCGVKLRAADNGGPLCR